MTNRRDLVISMPRRYYSKRTRVVRPRKRWATNFATVGQPVTATMQLTAGQVHTESYSNVLVQNTAQSSNPTPVIVKAGNFKIKGDMKLSLTQTSGSIEFGLPSMTSCVIYILYVPEGLTATAALITSHPEWIMAWSPVDINMDEASTAGKTQNVNKFSFSSRLKRNLNSGDSIVCLLVLNFATPADSGNHTVALNISPAILCQYWTCSN